MAQNTAPATHPHRHPSPLKKCVFPESDRQWKVEYTRVLFARRSRWTGRLRAQIESAPVWTSGFDVCGYWTKSKVYWLNSATGEILLPDHFSKAYKRSWLSIREFLFD